MRRHSDSHSSAQSVHDLWSFASPSKAGARCRPCCCICARPIYLLRLGASARSIRGIADNGIEGITFKRFQYLKRIALQNTPIFVIVHEFSRFLLYCPLRLTLYPERLWGSRRRTPSRYRHRFCESNPQHP